MLQQVGVHKQQAQQAQVQKQQATQQRPSCDDEPAGWRQRGSARWQQERVPPWCAGALLREMIEPLVWPQHGMLRCRCATARMHACAVTACLFFSMHACACRWCGIADSC